MTPDVRLKRPEECLTECSGEGHEFGPDGDGDIITEPYGWSRYSTVTERTDGAFPAVVDADYEGPAWEDFPPSFLCRCCQHTLELVTDTPRRPRPQSPRGPREATTMPNWCDNRLDVTGPEADLAAFVAKARGKERSSADDAEPSPLCADSFVPMPEELSETYYNTPTDPTVAARIAAQYGVPNGYEWQHANWGVKWGLCEVQEPDVTPERARYHFETPWSPPEELVRRMSEQHPTLRLRLDFDEPMVGLAGFSVYVAGREVEKYDRPD